MGNTRLIVLRGNSGSGKSSVAKEVRLAQPEKMAYVEQDNMRRVILKEKEAVNGFNIELIKQVILFSLNNSYHVIAEGMFRKSKYQDMFSEILKLHPNNNYFFYFDVSFEETLKRHQTKSNKDDFGEKEMREWYKDRDALDIVREEVIPESNSLEDSVKQILEVSQLKIR